MASILNPRTWTKAIGTVRKLWKPDSVNVDLDKDLAELREQLPTPVFWLFGKTQSGKTSVVRYLTGAEDAVIGNGFRPCTRDSQKYAFPNEDVPVLNFLDTRGVDEPGYNPAADLQAFDNEAHMVLVTCRIRDFAHGSLRESLRIIRKANPDRPIILVLTCLHEAQPQNEHPQPYPFDPMQSPKGKVPAVIADAPIEWTRLINEQAQQFDGLFDRIVPVDLTRKEEGYAEPNYGGEALKNVLLESLPDVYRGTFMRITDVTTSLKALHLKHAEPIIVAYASMAGTAGALPIPFLDLVMLPGIQARMVHQLGTMYGQPMTATRFLESAASLGLGLLARQAVREVVKFIPFVGSAAGGALAWASTYALGRAYCEYFQAVHQGHVPKPDDLKKLYNEQLVKAKETWFKRK